jgi:hypothetical protein
LKQRILAAGAVVAAFAISAAPAAAQTAVIQPGASMEADGSYCTLNWIYDGTGAQAGKVYAGTAAHCVSGVGQVVNLSTSSLGTVIERIGTVAFTGNADEPGRDYAFIEIDAEDVGKVNPALRGHPQIPTGVSRNYAKGDQIQFSGHGVGFHLTQPTRELRIGILNWSDGIEHSVLGPVISGDSGGPVADITDGNTALGIVNTVGVGVNTDALTIVTPGEGGTNLDFVLADAASRGFTVALKTVSG